MSEKKEITIKPPKTLGACVDLLYKLRSERLAFEKKAQAVAANESFLREYVINTFAASEVEGARGKVATASVNLVIVAAVEDWDAFLKHVAKTKGWDLLQRRVNDAAYRERLDAHKVVPGIKPFQIKKLSVTKR